MNSTSSHKGLALPITLVVLASLSLLGGFVLVFYHPSERTHAEQSAPAKPAPDVFPVPAPQPQKLREDTEPPKLKHAPLTKPAPAVATLPAIAPSPAAPSGSDNASGVQSGSNNQQTVQTMTNSPGGMQAGRDLYAIGKMPSLERIITPEDIKTAGDILSTGSGSIEIITFPTDLAPNSEIDRFATKLESALSQRGWSVYRNRENHLGTFNGRTDMPYGPHGVGCATSQPPSESAAIAIKALAALKYPCAGPSVVGGWGVEAGHFTLYITVGTRIVPEQ